MKRMQKAISLCLAAAPVRWSISGPYDAVDWDTWDAYKFQPHCHTNASDGYPTIHEFVQRHYDLDYDVVALTDHGTLNRGWDRQPDLVPLMRYVKKERTQMAEIVPLTAEEYAAVLWKCSTRGESGRGARIFSGVGIGEFTWIADRADAVLADDCAGEDIVPFDPKRNLLADLHDQILGGVAPAPRAGYDRPKTG